MINRDAPFLPSIIPIRGADPYLPSGAARTDIAFELDSPCFTESGVTGHSRFHRAAQAAPFEKPLRKVQATCAYCVISSEGSARKVRTGAFSAWPCTTYPRLLVGSISSKSARGFYAAIPALGCVAYYMVTGQHVFSGDRPVVSERLAGR